MPWKIRLREFLNAVYAIRNPSERIFQAPLYTVNALKNPSERISQAPLYTFSWYFRGILHGIRRYSLPSIHTVYGILTVLFTNYSIKIPYTV